MCKSWLDLVDKTVIITGGASGIGKEIAFDFVEQGSNVIIADLKEEGREVVQELNEIKGKHLFVQTDVTRKDSIKNMVEKTLDTYGKIDVLVNNAGICFPE